MERGMSLRILPRTLPGNSGNVCPLRVRVAEALRAAKRGSPAPAKEIANELDCTQKAAQRWLDAENDMQAATLIKACSRFDEVWNVVREQAGRTEANAERILDELAEKLRERTHGARGVSATARVSRRSPEI